MGKLPWILITMAPESRWGNKLKLINRLQWKHLQAQNNYIIDTDDRSPIVIGKMLYHNVWKITNTYSLIFTATYFAETNKMMAKSVWNSEVIQLIIQTMEYGHMD